MLFHQICPFDRFQRTAVDLTLPWRFANLPNNAKLEMVTRPRKQAVAESQVSLYKNVKSVSETMVSDHSYIVKTHTGSHGGMRVSQYRIVLFVPQLLQ